MMQRDRVLSTVLILFVIALVAAHYVAVRRSCDQTGGRLVRGAIVPFVCVGGDR